MNMDMDTNFMSLLSGGVDDIALDFDKLKQATPSNYSDYTRFTNLLLIEQDEDKIPDITISVDEFMKNNFLTNYTKAFTLAANNEKCEDENINSISRIIQGVAHNGYVIKDISSIKTVTPSKDLIEKDLV